MATKTTLRAELRRRRRARRRTPTSREATPPAISRRCPIPVRERAEAEGIARQVEALAASMGGATLPALFVPTPLEPDLSLTLCLFTRALLPKLLDEAAAPFEGPHWGMWEAGQGLEAPGPPPAQPSGPTLASEALAEADLILVPALAASPDGARLGQGGGWYDRALPHCRPGTPIVAVVFDEEVLDAGLIPVEPHDATIDAIITPTRTIDAAAR